MTQDNLNSNNKGTDVSKLSNNSKGLSRDIFILVLSAVISALVSLLVGMLQDNLHEQAHKESLVREIRTSISNDLQATIPVTEGIEDSLSKKQVMLNGFKLLYYPMVTFPADNLSVLSESTLNSIDEYQRRMSQCLRYHEEYENLLNTSAKNDQLMGTLITYYVSLDSVIKYGTNVIQDVDKNYPNLEKVNQYIPTYISKIDNICKEFSLNCH